MDNGHPQRQPLLPAAGQVAGQFPLPAGQVITVQWPSDAAGPIQQVDWEMLATGTQDVVVSGTVALPDCAPDPPTPTPSPTETPTGTPEATEEPVPTDVPAGRPGSGAGVTSTQLAGLAALTAVGVVGATAATRARRQSL